MVIAKSPGVRDVARVDVDHSASDVFELDEGSFREASRTRWKMPWKKA
jgi:hypothetical protein